MHTPNNRHVIGISDIRVGPRHRRDHGDLAGLAASIAEVGLLHPVVVRDDGTLIAGERRLRACQQLGWTPELNPPDLQQWVEHHGGYDKVDWVAWDQAVEAWRRAYQQDLEHEKLWGLVKPG